METVAIVVAKEFSKRLPGKSLMMLGGETILDRKLRTLKSCERITRTVVGTDSELIADIARSHEADVLWRDEYHCDESRCSANEMIFDVCSRVTEDIVVWAHPTNPLVRPETFDSAIQLFERGQPQYDSLCSVVAVKEHLWQDGRPFNFDPWGPKHVLAKDLPSLFMQNGAIFIQEREQMVDNKYFYGKRPYLFEMDEVESVDINEMKDYLIAKSYFEQFYAAHESDVQPCVD